MVKNPTRLLGAVILSAAPWPVVLGQQQEPDQTGSANPFARVDGAWITLTGRVEAVRANAFRLNYGDGTISVEMDDNDRDSDGYSLDSGDEVIVYGRVDDDTFEDAAIEARSVYVPKTSTYFFASAVDEEDIYSAALAPPAVDASSGTVRGRVSDVGEGEFSIDTGTDDVRVDIEEMSYDPLDDSDYQQIEVGDFVSVTGDIDRDFFEGRELQATTVLTLFEGDR